MLDQRASRLVSILSLVVFLTVVAGWIWFLTRHSLSSADSWSSILSGLIVLASAAAGGWSWWSGKTNNSIQHRKVKARNAAGKVFLGDTGGTAHPVTEEHRTVTLSGDVEESGVIDLGNHQNRAP